MNQQSARETSVAQIMELGGLEFMRRIVRGELPQAPISITLNFRLASAEPGLVVFRGTPLRTFYNPMEAVHGGFAATMLDSALACAIVTTLEPGYASTTLEIKINFVRPITDETGEVAAEGRIIHPGKRIATSEARLTDSTGKLLAHGTTTCMIMKM
jgi:uncharacterized protein (TIGR00369 family)